MSELPDTGGSTQAQTGLTRAVRAARRGLRRDVQAFIDALPDAELFVPLASDLVGAPEGERIEISEELQLVPHMLTDREGKLHCALFTRPEHVQHIEELLGWTTDGSDLKFCTIPALIALDMALQVIDEDEVVGVVFDAGQSEDLCLSRRELASIVQGKAIPLVGYVQDIPDAAEERTLVAEPAEPPPEGLVRELDACISELGLESYQLRRTFNAERDLEPHWTLLLKSPADTDHQAIVKQIIHRIEDKLPEPGYIDILFEDEIH